MKVYTLAFTDGINYGLECKEVFTFSNAKACYKALRAKFIGQMRDFGYTDEQVRETLDNIGEDILNCSICYGGTYAYISEMRWETFTTDVEDDYEVQDAVEEEPVAKKEITYEVCPECEEEVELPATLGIHTCPKCGKPIISCSMCPEEGRDCANCKLCKEVEKLRAVKEEPKKDRSDYVVDETEAVMFIGMYVFPRINKYIEFDGWDGETRFVRRLAEDFADFIYKEADWMTMSIYDYAEEFGQDALEAMLRRERYEEFIFGIDYPEWFDPEA